jgi:amino acid adenylation domain-containing protein
MNTIEFLTYLRTLGVTLSLEGEGLRYSAASGVMTPELRRKLVARKEELIVFLRDARAASGVAAPRLAPVERGGALPLSYAQQRLWFLQQLDPLGVAYNVPVALRLTGNLNLPALEQAFGEIVRRHETLRTTFKPDESGAVQFITPHVEFNLGLADLSGISEREALRRSLARAEMARAFDLARGPALRAHLLRLAGDEQVVLLTVHHIAVDGWSMGLLVDELAALYEAFAAGRPSPLPELKFQYADYAAWQLGWLKGEVLERQLDYWRRQLAGAPPQLDLPTDRTRTSGHVARSEDHVFELPAGLAHALGELSRREGATLFMTLHAAFQILLHKYAGQPEIVVGTPVAGRNLPEIEGMVGFFVNALALRVGFSGDPGFRQVLRNVREVSLQAYAHQDVPFEMLVEELQPERSAGRAPLFQVMFALQNAPRGALRLPGLQIEIMRVEDASPQFELILDIAESDDARLQCRLRYDASLFDSGTIRRMAGHYRQLLETIVAAPERKISALELLTHEERELLLRRWNDTGSDYPLDKRIHELVEAQAAQTPDAVAVVFGETQLTYSELNARANQLAHHLRRLGIGADSPVGICVERSVEMIVGLLGILKAGGAYVPLDPSYPLERISFMIDDVQPAVLLTTEKFADELPVTWAQLIMLDTGWELIAGEETANLDGATPDSDNLAYVMYTSGSTGVPKGVAATHRGVVRLVRETNYASFSQGEVFLQFAPISFDASTLEIWGALLNGGRLVVMPPGQLSLDELSAVLDSQNVSTLWLSAGLFHQLVDLRPQALRGLRQLLAGGDVLSPSHVRRSLENMAAGSVLINGYGPTEGTTFTCCHRINAEESDFDGSVSIGRPIANTSVYILDEGMRAVPIGIPGELFIGGDGLARGYFNRPQLTAEKFLPHPFSLAGGERLYRTGDLTRWKENGEIEFLGRVDHQVKVRGFRIEPGEIEAALSQHPAVRESVIIVRESETGDKSIVAYVVAEQDAAGAGSVKAGELRGHLKERVPEYMIPQSFVALEELPLTENGKVDRRALPAPESGVREGEAEFVAPRSAVEELVAGIWGNVLGVERVSIEDNFFELGGHSLLATQVVTRVREALNVELPLRRLFETPTVAEVAQSIETELRGVGGRQAPPIVPVPRDAELPLSFAQERLWFIDQLEPNSAAYNVSTAFRLTGSLNVQALTEAFNEIMRRHENLRTGFTMGRGRPVQVIAAELELSLPLTDLSVLADEEQAAQVLRLASADAHQPFDLTRAPLFRLSLLRLSEEEHVLLLTMHHIISDGWSIGVLVKEVAALYEARSGGNESLLEELPIQYADFAVWQRDWLRGEALEEQLQYWREKLSGAPAVLELPTDRPRPAVQTFNGALSAFSLSRELREGLKALSRREGVTLFMTLLAAWQTLLSLYSRQHDIIVGSPIANRTRAETESLIGFFVNMLVMRGDLSGEPTFRELLARVRESALGAYAHQDVPFEKLVEELAPDRTLSHSPLFQIVFVLQNAPMPELKLPGLTLHPLDFELNTTHVDATLIMEETAEGMQGTAQYNTDLFDASTISRLLRHFHSLLASISADVDVSLSGIVLLSAEESRQLLSDWCGTRSAYPRHLSIHELFEQQAAATPDAIAVQSRDVQLSYAELSRRSDALAAHLRRVGVRREAMVGLLLERGAETVVGLLAILKAGGVYVPLDAQYPHERLQWMVEDAGVKVVLTQERVREVAERLSAATGAAIINLDGEPRDIEQTRQSQQAIARAATDAGREKIDAERLAYVIYTSGSTGVPKGVAVTHQSVVRLVRETNYASFSPSEVFLQLAPITFDASTLEIWGALLNGGRCVLPAELALTAGEIRAVIERYGVSTMWLTSSLFNSIINEEADALASLRQLLVGGEALSVRHISEALKRLPQTQLINGYGPTEGTTFTCCYRIPQQTGRSVTSIPIGTPIANTSVYILDEGMRTVPVGIPGELFIGGDGLARGYLNRPQLTAEKFLPHPFSTDGGERLYRTGDLTRWKENGEIEFLGRVDHQVKVRGFRIEPGEIEAVLSQHPAVRESVVIVRESEAGDKSIVAYVVAEQDAAGAGNIKAGELRNHLKERVPEYMIPQSFVALEELPLTENGKVDRRALPAPESGGREGEAEFVAPRSAVEELVAGIWGNVLGVERVSIEDNFFELGGHSLLATQIISRVREVLGVGLALRTLFESPTVEGLAARIENEQREQSGAEQLPRLAAHARSPGEPVVLSYAQQRFWLLHQLEPGGSAYNVPSATRLGGRLNVAALEQALDSIVERHEVLRTTFAAVNGEPQQFVNNARRAPLPIVDLTPLTGSALEEASRRLSSAEARRPFDLSRGPLFRARLLRLGEEEHALLLTIHHIVADGWSMDVIVRELAAHYENYATGEPSSLPALPVQYADFAVWQRQLEGTGYRVEQLEYWKNQLRAPLPALDLPADRPRPHANSYRGASLPLRLSDKLTRSLHAISRREGATLYMTLLAAFKTLLYRYTGQADLIVGSPVANRERAEMQDLIGCLINTLALRTDVGGNPSFAELLHRVREVVLGGHARGEVPHEQVVEAVQPQRRGGDNPLFRVWFVLLNVEMEKLRSAGLEIEPLPIDSGTVQFDLVLTVEEREAELHCEFAYSTDLFDAATVEAFAEHYRGLLEQVAAGNTSCGVLDIPLSSPQAALPATATPVVAAPPEEQEQYAL